MDYLDIGKNIKDLREYYGISQRELAKGICTQPTISNIEKGENFVAAQLLHMIAERLGVDINYFFNIAETPKIDYMNETFYYIRLYVRQGKFTEAKKLISSEKNNPLFRALSSQQFFHWQLALCTYYLEGKFEESIKMLEDSLLMRNTTSKNYSEREVEIIISIAILYSENKDYKTANINYEKALSFIKKLPKIQDKLIEPRLYYNYSKCLYDQSIYAESVNLSTQGIIECKHRMSTYLLGELYYQKGKSLLYLNDTNEDTIEYFHKALWYFKENENQLFYTLVNDELKTLTN
ncbi:transcriptional regulator, XRE (plasmid) [Alkalihalophilus pseudofirmus OF4]|uniref:Transcriptional regulator, XRE n=1 Tax=Alkalihalophilus pseudofirmus (strain ATCC BAA-2126 / JCM 17055 / OF4) TaxID=398511 RepID=D3G1N8_ALKPO|nr:helix-turn-helix domain-containing protein [Alkalihalophilus pseudofirmus]ADC52264.1 transcriptional regulator, XRE [Alkalihalophilus pseudofirmus OF4]